MCLHVIFIAVFYTKHLTPHTILYVSIPHSLLLSHSFVAIKQEIYCTVFYTGEPKSLCSSTTVALHCANTVHDPHKWLNDPIVTRSQYLQSPYYRQLCCKHIHWYSHSNRNPTTDSWAINFLSPCTLTHNTVINACYSKNIVINL
jgi:hypothetical protein